MTWVDSFLAFPEIVHFLSPDDENKANDAGLDGTKMVFSVGYCEGDPNARFYDYPKDGAPTLKGKSTRVLSKADLVLCPNDSIASSLKEQGVAAPVKVLPPSVNLTRFEFASLAERNVFKRYFGIRDEDKYVIATGDYGDRKILDLLKEIATMCPKVKFFFFGTKKHGAIYSIQLKNYTRKAPKNLRFNPIVEDDVYRSAMIPAGMYLLTSLTLAVGVILLARKRMLVQELYCIEMLARVDVLCLDKTGTLTDGTMSVENVYPSSALSDEEIEDAIRSVIYSVGDNNATALALKKRYSTPYPETPTHVISFDSETKFSAASFKDKGTFILGAFGFVDAKENEEAAVRIDTSSKAGYRCLCLYRNKKEIVNGILPSGSDIVAVILLSDHIKEDAAENIAWFKKNGVSVRVISGDNPLTVSQIATKVGVDGAANYVSCEGRSEADLIKLAQSFTVFGRVTPEQKEILIKAYQRQGHTVAMFWTRTRRLSTPEVIA